MDKKFRIEDIQAQDLSFNNGAFNVNLQTQALLDFLRRKGVPPTELLQISNNLIELSKKMMEGKDRGMAYGSTMPLEAIFTSSGIWNYVEKTGASIESKDISPFVKNRLVIEHR